MTFGTHNARDHAIFFDVSGPVLNDDGQDWGWTSLAGIITGGQGVFADYEGIITVGGSTNGTSAFALVSGHVWQKNKNLPK